MKIIFFILMLTTCDVAYANNREAKKYIESMNYPNVTIEQNSCGTRYVNEREESWARYMECTIKFVSIKEK